MNELSESVEKNCRVVAMLNPKGGVGKSTISINMAYAMIKYGLRVLLIDSDPQGTVMDWHVDSGGDVMPIMSMTKPTIAHDVRRERQNYDYIIIDGPGRTSELNGLILSVSDLVLIPVQPSPADIKAARRLVNTIHSRRIELDTDQPLAAFVVSMEDKTTEISRRTDAIIIEKNYNFPIFESRTADRISYVLSYEQGKTVFHWNDLDAKNEMGAMAMEVIEFLNKGGGQ